MFAFINSQVRITTDGGPTANELSCVTKPFPTASTIELAWAQRAASHYSQVNRSPEQLFACLEALPDRCWPSVEVICLRSAQADLGELNRLPARAAAHAARLCPRMRTAGCCSGDGVSLVAGLEGLVVVAATLEELDVDMSFEPGAGDAKRAGAALGRLARLRRLSVVWSNFRGSEAEIAAVGLLHTALPSLTALSSLRVMSSNRLERRLDTWPTALRELKLASYGSSALGALRAASHLGGITKLGLVG